MTITVWAAQISKSSLFPAADWGFEIQKTFKFTVMLALAATLIASGSHAQDVVPSIVKPFNWTGLYVGAHMGHLITDISTDVMPAGQSTSGSWSDLAVGGYVGANYQFGSWVVGLEGDVSRDEMPGAGPAYSLRARAGYTLGPALFYGTAGLALRDKAGRWTTSVLVPLKNLSEPRRPPSRPTLPGPFLPGTYITEEHELMEGFVLGLGIEYKLSQNIAIRSEVFRTDYGSTKFKAPDGMTTANLKSDSLAARVGFTIMFP